MKWRIPLFTSDPEAAPSDEVSFPEYERLAIPRDAEHGKDIYYEALKNYLSNVKVSVAKEFWFSLHTADPGETLANEVAYPGYHRVKLTRGAEWLQNSMEILFPCQAGPGLTRVPYVSISDETGNAIVTLNLNPVLSISDHCQPLIWIDPSKFGLEAVEGDNEDSDDDDILDAIRDVARGL